MAERVDGIDCGAQKSEITQILNIPLTRGAVWYLLDMHWYKQWKKYVGFDEWDTDMAGVESANPGPIDNSNLFTDDGVSLKEGLCEDTDYVLLPELAWNKLVTWYKIASKQEPISRKVIEQGIFQKQLVVEVYLVELKLMRASPDRDQDVRIGFFSKSNTIEELEIKMREEFNIVAERDVILWHQFNTTEHVHLDKPDSTLMDANLYSGQVVVIEVVEPTGEGGNLSWTSSVSTVKKVKPTYPSIGDSSYIMNNVDGVAEDQVSSTTSNLPIKCVGFVSAGSASLRGSASSSSYFNNYSDSYRSSGPGLCGLNNLGNTCFMNSALQCMSNVPTLTRYMLSDEWKVDLNEDNPLGMHGEIASSYAQLVQNIWSGQCSTTAPRSFKLAVGRFKPEFSGYQQQDSQELMAFLLDGLHEDLNRIKKKPYVEMKEANDRPDEVVAKEVWEDYVKRNDSVIVDTFHGLLKSTLVCPDCSKISVKFDPFCYLSLPLPVKKDRQIEIIFMPADPMRIPCQYKLTVPNRGSISQICNALSLLTSIPADKLIVVDVYTHRFHKIFSCNDGLTNILDRDDIFVYELSATEREDPNILHVPVYLREEKAAVTYGSGGGSSSSRQLFGTPILVAVPRHGCTYDVLYNSILNKMARYVKVSEITEAWSNPSVQPSPVKKTHVRTKQHALDDEDPVEENGDSPDSSTPNNDDPRPDPDVNLDLQSDSGSEDAPLLAVDDEEDTVMSADDSQGGSSDQGSSPVPGVKEGSSRGNKRRRRLFTIRHINSYGTTEVDRLSDDGTDVKFGNHPYLAVDWCPKAKELFFDDKRSEDMDVDNSMNVKQFAKRQEVLLTDCLELFATKERLGEHDLWYCPVCKNHQQASKKFDIWQLPQILVIHLKRFTYTRYSRDKLDTFVSFPTSGLDMKRWIINDKHCPAVYDLIAVSNHYGGLGGGHYTAFAKNDINKKWYHFDDSSVSASSEDAVVTKAGYVLVYQRREHASSVDPLPSSISSNSPSAGAAGTSRSKSSAANHDEDNDDNLQSNRDKECGMDIN